MTDRECLIAIFRALQAVHLAVSGKPLTVRVETEGGEVTISDGPVSGLQLTAAGGQSAAQAG
jgi:hypothetical protein